MSNLDRMRQAAKQRAKPTPGNKPTPEEKEAKKALRKARKEARDNGPKHQYTCGHEAAIAAVFHRVCPACKEVNRKRKAEIRAKKFEAKKAARDICPETGRLPHGSKFEIAPYDSVTKSWSGTLTIGESTYSAANSGLFNLLKDLDKQYRKSLGIPVESS